MFLIFIIAHVLRFMNQRQVACNFSKVLSAMHCGNIKL